MNAFDVLADPVRRRLLDLLRTGGGGLHGDATEYAELSAGELVTAVQAEFDISQPTISAHLRVLRDAGLAVSRAEGNRRLYRVNADPLRELEEWLAPYRGLYLQRLDALGTELARGRRARRQSTTQTEPATPTEPAETSTNDVPSTTTTRRKSS